MDENYSSSSRSSFGGNESLPNATAILVLGIVSIVICQPLGIAALVMANNSIRTYEQNPEKYSENSLSTVKAGRICGIIGICLMVVGIILWIAGVSILGTFGLESLD